jgi:hypothetical protein
LDKSLELLACADLGKKIMRQDGVPGRPPYQKFFVIYMGQILGATFRPPILPHPTRPCSFKAR